VRDCEGERSTVREREREREKERESVCAIQHIVLDYNVSRVVRQCVGKRATVNVCVCVCVICIVELCVGQYESVWVKDRQ